MINYILFVVCHRLQGIHGNGDIRWHADDRWLNTLSNNIRTPNILPPWANPLVLWAKWLRFLNTPNNIPSFLREKDPSTERPSR